MYMACLTPLTYMPFWMTTDRTFETLEDQVVHADGDQEAASSQSTPVKQKAASASEGEVTPQKRGTKSKEMWTNMLLCAYTVCHKGWSASVFEEMMTFARRAGGALPSCHDSSTVFYVPQVQTQHKRGGKKTEAVAWTR